MPLIIIAAGVALLLILMIGFKVNGFIALVLVAAVVGTVGPAIGPTSASAEKPVEDTIAAVRSAAALFLKLFFINMPFLRWRRSPPSFDF